MSARALRRAAFAIVWVAISASATRALAQAARDVGPKLLPSIHEWKLPNGLTVAHVERSGLPMVTVQVWYRFGSADEPTGQHGAARMFERLMFMGSEHLRGEDHRAYIEQVGGETGALVTEDVSAFHDTVPVDQLELALQLEAERMRGLLIRGDALEAVRPAMVDEVRRQEGGPVFRAYQRLLSLTFTVHPYAWPPLGVGAEIEKLTPQQVKSLYDAYYVPGNALLVVVGGVSTEVAAKAVERWFGPIAAAPAPAHPGEGKVEPAQTEARRQELAGSPVGVVMAGYRLPPATDADVLALQVAGVILTNGASSRLHRRVLDAKLADEVGGQVLVRHDGGVLVAFARFAGGTAAAVEKALVGEIDRMAKQGPTAAELRRAKGLIPGAASLGMESATGLANQIGVSWGLTGKPAGFLADLDSLESLSVADVKRAAGKYLASSQQVIVTAEPGAARPAGGTP
jgi:zinc protease